ncbi:MAG: ABC transporter ATP-binding protein [Candidatus Nanopelagicales bacterium]
MTPVLLATRELVCRFGDFTAVAGVSLSVSAGEVIGLLGANGAGKTTLIRAALGLLAPTAGAVEVLGGRPERATRARIGYVAQGLGLYSDLTVAENLAFVGAAYGVTARLPEPLVPLANQIVGKLSLGSQRQLAFAAAVAHDPALLVLDEPTSGVGALSAARLWDAIHERAEAGVGVLVTTHNMAEAAQCDRLVLMAGGRVVAAGSRDDIVGGTTAVEVSTPDWSAAFLALSAAGLPVTLDGTAVRVADVPAAEVEAALAAAGIAGSVRSEPATIEERMLALAAG